MIVTAGWYMTLAAVLFLVGTGGLLLRSNALVMFMSVELMLNAVNLTFVAAARAHGDIGGQMAVLFVLVVAAPRWRWGWRSSCRSSAPGRPASVDDLAELSG